ncbi:phage portal protein [Clostridium sp. AF15-6B]|nr:phage portal protein [Clostridium sp. AF16-25]RGH02963.1 phage portal protein [Clostridium sp. AF15-49]RGH07594.1 phage portal protein [Clostridium sp. AF15-6B]
MSKKNNLIQRALRKARRTRSAVMIGSTEAYDILCGDGYTSLDQNPEIVAACRKIAEVVGAMTIHVMENTERGDERVINELSRKIDINPCSSMTRQTFIEAIVMNLLLYGKGNSVVKVYTEDGYLSDMEPVAANRVLFQGDYTRYRVMIDGIPYAQDEVMHFVYNPDKVYMYKGQGVTAQLKDVADNLRQAQVTTNAFMKSKYKPSLIVKVDGMTEEFSSPKGRQKLINEYMNSGEAGAPWLIPAEQFEIEQIKPLSLSDLAISDNVKLDKQSVAAILGVPAFVLGVGEYKQDEWNYFVKTKIKTIVTGLQQEMTRKLIYSPNMYIKFNVLSVMDWDLTTIASVFGSLSDRGFVTGNEVRDKIGMSPKEGLDELRVLENYIPWDMAAAQKKLIQKGEDNG